MKKRFFFDEYCPDELRDTQLFDESIKAMSFCEIDNDCLMNYIVVKKSVSPLLIPNVNMNKGCEITAIKANYATSELRNNVFSEMFQEILFDAQIWVNDDAEDEFNYLWFNLKNFNMDELYKSVMEEDIPNDKVVIGDIVYIKWNFLKDKDLA